MKTSTTTKNKPLILYITLGLFFISLLYGFEFFQNFSNEYNIAKKELLNLKNDNKNALNKLKENATNNSFYPQYLEVNKKYKASIKKLEQVKKNEQVFWFKNMRVFLYELLPIFALLVYFIFNLYRSFKNESKNLGIKLIHGVFIMYAFFKLFWIFQQFQDFAKPIYYVMTLISAYLVGLAVYLIHKQEVSAFKKLRKKLLTVSYFAVKNTEGEKKDKMLEVLKNIAEN